VLGVGRSELVEDGLGLGVVPGLEGSQPALVQGLRRIDRGSGSRFAPGLDSKSMASLLLTSTSRDSRNLILSLSSCTSSDPACCDCWRTVSSVPCSDATWVRRDSTSAQRLAWVERTGVLAASI
jgi:hypothetical protein